MNTAPNAHNPIFWESFICSQFILSSTEPYTIHQLSISSFHVFGDSVSSRSAEYQNIYTGMKSTLAQNQALSFSFSFTFLLSVFIIPSNFVQYHHSLNFISKSSHFTIFKNFLLSASPEGICVLEAPFTTAADLVFLRENKD